MNLAASQMNTRLGVFLWDYMKLVVSPDEGVFLWGHLNLAASLDGHQVGCVFMGLFEACSQSRQALGWMCFYGAV